jgi:hypothetical protein
MTLDLHIFEKMISFHKYLYGFFLIACFSISVESECQTRFSLEKGKAHFSSNAPEEEIEATSRALSGLMDINQNAFAFSIDIKTFKGFNSPLQQEHFYENYMETDKYPKSIFTGKLIDKFDPLAVSQTVRAKGQFEIHGIKKERIIEVNLKKTAKGFEMNSNFNVLLEEHGIEVPHIVFQKISANINISVSGEMLHN